ncbi:MAG TPA: molybdopterin-dependent oxidoreductase [Mycobacteriales bacterium]|nr:molybdopterin-dependent oxidoreductase [Mycobacteriales bacterium]
MDHRERFLGAVAGLIGAGVALGAGELAAAVIRPQAAPLAVVGDAAIDLSPGWLKDFAIATFGSSDKPVLVAGIAVVLGLCAAVAGAFAVHRPRVGLSAVGGLGALGLAAALTRPDVRPLDGLPSVVAAVAAGWALHLLLWRRPAAKPVHQNHQNHQTRSARTARTAGARRPTGTRRQTGAAARGANGRADGNGRAAGARQPAAGALDRRRFLRTGGALAGAAAVVGVTGREAQGARFDVEDSRAALRVPTPADTVPALPAGKQLNTPGASRFYTPNSSFYRVDTAIVLPQLRPETWSLRIHGMVDRPLTLNYDKLVARSLVERDVTLTCVSDDVGGPYVGNARWIGAHLAELLDEAGIQSGANQLVSRSADGLTVGTPTSVVTDGRDAMLAVAMNGDPLPVKHGFPVRMVVPGLFGYVSACKWIVDIEVTTFDAFDAYWVERGWARKGPIVTQSRIDTPKVDASLTAGPVAIAGVAWAQHRGIEKVEVQVDSGPWHTCVLGGVPSTDTWRQWAYHWNATPGPHQLRVRATDETGQTQPQQRTSPFPSGATGWHTVAVTVT